MKVMRKSVLASSLVMLPSLAQALGLGAIEVKSALNQPLNAEIAVIQAGAGEAAGLAVDLAKAEDFARVGIDRARLAVPLEFAIGENARGEPVIRVTSNEPIREPFLTFLLDVNWDRGRLLREYTVLLDPPVMAPARRGSSVASAPAARPAPVAKPEPLAPATPPQSAPAVAAAPAATPAPTPPPPAPAPVATPAPALAAAAGGSEYGPVGSGETLWEVATATRPAGVDDMNRLMLTLLRMNPNAFYEDNINALKRGAVLRIPTAAEVNAISVVEARDAVAQQNEIWRGYQERAAGRTTSLADAGGSRPGSSSSSSDGGGRLELVPPRASSGDQGGADRPGSGGMDSSSSAMREVRADLARSQEDLTTARAEASELRSRVGDLEKIKADQERLLKLRDDELASLQARIAELERQQNAAASVSQQPPVAVTPPADPLDAEPLAGPSTDEGSVSAQDIWGGSETPSSDADSSVDEGSADDGSTEPMIDEPPVSTEDPAPAVTQPVPEPVSAPPQPVTPTPAPTPAPASTPWYQNLYLIGGGVAALLAIVGLLVSRRRKSEPAIGDYGQDDDDGAVDFGIPGAAAAPASDDGDFLYELQGRLSRHPGDLDAHLQLLRHLYAQGDSDGFEQAAEAMLPHVHDQHGPEWSEARSLGEALLPGNPLFAEPQRFDFDSSEMEADRSPMASDDDDALSFEAFEEPAQTMEAPALDLPRSEPSAARGVAAAEAAADAPAGDGLDFDFDFDAPTQVIEPVRETAATATADLLDEAAAAADATTLEVERAGEQAAAEFDAALDAAGDSVKSDDLELPALDFDFSQETEIKRPEVVGFADAGRADGGLNFDSGLPDAARAVDTGAPAAVESPAEDDFLELDFGSLGESDAVGTKLDLARAYIDMGDPDGARSMLEEVISEGNAGQRSEAEKLLGSLG